MSLKFYNLSATQESSSPSGGECKIFVKNFFILMYVHVSVIKFYVNQEDRLEKNQYSPR